MQEIWYYRRNGCRIGEEAETSSLGSFGIVNGAAPALASRSRQEDVMCWGCKPTCNNCKPAEQLFVVCPSCGMPQGFTRSQFLMYFDLPHRINDAEAKMRGEWDGQMPLCPACGFALADELRRAVSPLPCVKSHIVCGYPCGQRKTLLPRGGKPCSKMVPLARYDGDLSEEGCGDANLN